MTRNGNLELPKESKKVLDFKPFNLINYKKMDLDRLTLVSINELLKKNIEPTYENIVAANYRLFPEKFALPNFPQYPDGKRIHDSLFHMFYKSKKWLIGNIRSGFTISEKGYMELGVAYKRLGNEEHQTGKGRVRRKELHILEETKKSTAYEKWLSGDKSKILKWEILDAVKSRTDGSAKTNIELRMKYAEAFEDKGIVDFLMFVKEILKVGLKNG